MRRVRLALGIALVAGVALASPGVARAAGQWPWPVGGAVTLGYGATYTNAQGTACTHGGIDIGSAAGSVVRACSAGEVTFCGLVPAGEGQRAWAVTVLTADALRVTYLPLSRASVSRGQRVEASDTLGESSSSGDASSPDAHLHLGVRRGERALDPLSFLADPRRAPATFGGSTGAAPAAPAPPAAGRQAPAVSSAAPAGAPVASRASVSAPSSPVRSAQPAAALPSPDPLLASLPVPSASMAGLGSLPRIPTFSEHPQVRTSAVSADVGRLRDLLAAVLVRLGLAGVAGACAWPALRSVLALRRSPAPVPVAVRRDGA